VGTNAQPNLSPMRQVRSHGHRKRGGKAVIDVMTVLLGVFSVGLFLAHAVEAYRVR
jgi:hypothetical protein